MKTKTVKNRASNIIHPIYSVVVSDVTAIDIDITVDIKHG
eukprot:CAMPEP_0170806034 /NCGR_PEP_ID=MMETSP0733-20121128/31777_1 /TAXON_ID=186038 /ORGANISM="Fragilariopsis kerguelensis, Strain L26-C5" /LENGTH=39 /DNA_ID= /DNA_START= /DNA_END= /DNA_ORIENTATION=